MSSWGQQYFRQGKQKYRNDKSHWESRCKACIAQWVRELKQADEADVTAGVRDYIRSAEDLDTEAEQDVPAISGKLERWLSHLSRCHSVTPEVQALAKAAAKKENPNGPNIRLSCVQDAACNIMLSLPQSDSNIHGPSRHHASSLTTLIDAMARMTLNVPHALREQHLPSTRGYGVMWDPPAQDEFAQDLCKLFVACNMPWNSASNPQLNLFFSKYVPEAKIPDRHVLSGRILDSLAAQAEAGMKSNVAGRLGTGQCDGWKTNAKAAIISTSVTVEATLYMIAAHDVSPERKTADNLLQIVLEDIMYCEEHGIIMVGYCTDNGGDARRMRVRLTRVKPKLTVPPCWGHQTNLVAAEVLELEIPCMLFIDESLEIIKWFTNHSHAIGLVKVLLEPLAIAAKCMQAPDAGLDQVLLMLGNLYRIYSSPEINSRVRTCIWKSLEKCWLPMEQEVFIIAVYLNPYIRGTAFSTKNPVVKLINLYNIAKQLFQTCGSFPRVHEPRGNETAARARASLQTQPLRAWVQQVQIVFNQASKPAIHSKSVQDDDGGYGSQTPARGIGATTDRIKWKFMLFAEQYVAEGNGGAQAMDYNKADSFASLVTQLCDDLTNTRNAPIDEEDEDDDEAIPAVYSCSNYTLKELFQYPTNGTESLENGLGFYWQGGVKDLEEEMELYNIFMEDLNP
ncbi:hypothetical protein B0H10DRAFT_2259901 [Mycena sp. CBHHK59/15]|nr:hypothetical protein B0H10DRAFT_2259901 [Mycena sp. CBHHK59/15]